MKPILQRLKSGEVLVANIELGTMLINQDFNLGNGPNSKIESAIATTTDLHSQINLDSITLFLIIFTPIVPTTVKKINIKH